MNRPAIWFGTSERLKMFYLWVLAVATVPVRLTVLDSNFQHLFVVSPWEPIWLLPFRILAFAWNAFEFLVSLPFQPEIFGNLIQVAINKVVLFVNAFIVDPMMGVAYVLGPIIAAVVWVKLGTFLWNELAQLQDRSTTEPT